MSVLSATTTKREAKAYLSRFGHPQLTKPRKPSNDQKGLGERIRHDFRLDPCSHGGVLTDGIHRW